MNTTLPTMFESNSYPPTRKRILEAGLKVFATYGYHKASFTEITREAGVARGLVHYYFRNKEELLEVILDEALRVLKELRQDLQRHRLPQRKLERLIQQSIQLLRAEPDFYLLIFRLLLQENLPHSILKKLRRTYNQSVRLAAEILNENGIADATANARLLIAELDGIFIHHHFLRKQFPLRKIARILLNRYLQLAQNSDGADM